MAHAAPVQLTVGGYMRSRCPLLPPQGTQWDARRLAQPAWPLPAAFQDFYMLALGEMLSLCEAAEHANKIRPIRLVAARNPSATALPDV